MTPGPQVACAENRSLGPREVCAEPVCNGIVRPVFPRAVEGVGVEAAGVQDRAMGWNMSLSSPHPFPRLLRLLVRVGKKDSTVNTGLASGIKRDGADLEATNGCVKMAVRATVLQGRWGLGHSS